MNHLDIAARHTAQDQTANVFAVGLVHGVHTSPFVKDVDVDVEGEEEVEEDVNDADAGAGESVFSTAPLGVERWVGEEDRRRDGVPKRHDAQDEDASQQVLVQVSQVRDAREGLLHHEFEIYRGEDEEEGKLKATLGDARVHAANPSEE